VTEGEPVTQAALIWCPFPDIDAAKSAAEQLLSEDLIACANILPQVVSVFEWDGQASSANEVVAILKTSAELLDSVIARLGECHPYDTPAIVGWRCDGTHQATRNWLSEVLT